VKDLAIHIVCAPGMFRDLLSSAVARAGSSLKSQKSLHESLEDVDNGDCFIVHVPTTDDRDIARLKSIRASHPDAIVIILCSPGMEPYLHSQTDYWANAIIPDNQPLDMVIKTLGVVSYGYSVLDTNTVNPADVLAPGDQNTASSCPLEMQECDLSKREVTVLKEIRVGRSNKEIARVLDISDSTVKVHMRSIFRKIGVRNRTEAAIWITSHTQSAGHCVSAS